MFGELENAVTARLKKASDLKVLGYKFGTLETYPADWDAYLGTKVLTFPAAWTTFGGMTEIEPVSQGAYVELHFGIVVAAQNQRNETATRQGVPGIPGEPGSYQLVKDVIALIMGNNLGLDWAERCRFHAVKFVQSTPKIRELGLSMMAVGFKTRTSLMSENINLTDEFEGDLELVDVQWDIPPFTNPKPADWTPDAEDKISLPGCDQEEA